MPSYRTQTTPAESVKLTIRLEKNSVVKNDNIPIKKIVEKVRAVISGVITAKILPSGDIKITLENPL